MKTLYLIAAFGMIAYTSCSDKSSRGSQEVVDTVITQPTVRIDTAAYSPAGCYLMSLNKDSASMNLEIKDGVISGNLNYIFFQKDANIGTVNGTWSDSMIRAFYTFRSEGVISVREVAWKIRSNELWPAFGNITQRNDTVFFEKPDRLQFDNVHPFIKIACSM